MKKEEPCYACLYSGSDEAAYCAYGCPDHTCQKEKPESGVTLEESDGRLVFGTVKK